PTLKEHFTRRRRLTKRKNPGVLIKNTVVLAARAGEGRNDEKAENHPAEYCFCRTGYLVVVADDRGGNRWNLRYLDFCTFVGAGSGRSILPNSTAQPQTRVDRRGDFCGVCRTGNLDIKRMVTMTASLPLKNKLRSIH